MKERGLMLSMKSGDLLLLNYWRCWLGHKWFTYDHTPGYPKRRCERCHRYMARKPVWIGRPNDWVWITPPVED